MTGRMEGKKGNAHAKKVQIAKQSQFRRWVPRQERVLLNHAKKIGITISHVEWSVPIRNQALGRGSGMLLKPTCENQQCP